MILSTLVLTFDIKIVSQLGYDADDIKADPKAYAKLPKCCKHK